MALAALPPGPEGHFLTGNTLDFKRDPLGFLAECSREYGDVVRLSFPGKLVYLLNNPDYIGFVLAKNNRNFTRSRARYFRRFRRDVMLAGDSLLASEGEFWSRQRRLTQPAFHHQRINEYGQVMVSCTERMLINWQDGEVRDIHQEMMRLGLDILARTLFDVGAGRIEEVKKALGQIAETFGGGGGSIQLHQGYYSLLLQLMAYLRFRKALAQLDKITYSIINEHRGSGKDTGDLLSMLLHFQDEDGNRMGDKQLRDEVVSMFFAGYEATTTSLAWTWYLLSQHPETETKLLEELQEVTGDRAPTVEDLPQLRYTEMVIKESMRIYPPVWRIGRKAKEECEIGGYQVPPGTHLMISPWVTHHDPRYFEHPQAFDPNRWKDESVKRLPRYAYLPFGGGRRRCIGSAFALTEATLVLARIVKSYRLKLAAGQRVPPQPSITLRPTGGVRMLLERRSPSA